MQRSSESIACLAAALAKAQAELTNPENDDQAEWPRRGRTVVPLCPTVERARHRPQDLRPA
jgi:hypothetical protein